MKNSSAAWVAIQNPTNRDARVDRRHMEAALALAERGLGSVWPNPAVGCVLVRDGRIVGRGWTQPGGRPHAETEALRRAGCAAKGATAYVTLEPCSHHGKSPPCADALIGARIASLVVAMKDPDPRVSGQGFARIAEAGIEVAVGVCGEEASRLNAGFVKRIKSGRPLVTIKQATSLDGRIATRSGESQWITGMAARARGHLLRAHNDAILVGSGTAIADDPSLTCRLPGLEECSPVRVVMDGRLRLPESHRLVAEARDVPTWIVTLDNAARTRGRGYREAGVKLITVAPDEVGHPDAAATLQELGAHGITRVLIEGGAYIVAAFLGARLVDRLDIFRAPYMIGGDGAPAAESLALARLADAPTFARRAIDELGSDIHENFDAVV